MAAKTKITMDGNNVTISLSGCLDFETPGTIKENLKSILSSGKKIETPQIIFDFSDLSFVGSCGITAFVQVLKDFNSRIHVRPKYLNVKNEFKRIIAAFDSSDSFDFSEPTLSAKTMGQFLDN